MIASILPPLDDNRSPTTSALPLVSAHHHVITSLFLTSILQQRRHRCTNDDHGACQDHSSVHIVVVASLLLTTSASSNMLSTNDDRRDNLASKCPQINGKYKPPTVMHWCTNNDANNTCFGEIRSLPCIKYGCTHSHFVASRHNALKLMANQWTTWYGWMVHTMVNLMVSLWGYQSGPDKVSIFWGLCCKNYCCQLCADGNGEMNGWVSRMVPPNLHNNIVGQKTSRAIYWGKKNHMGSSVKLYLMNLQS
jgi:hypothetical protein